MAAISRLRAVAPMHRAIRFLSHRAFGSAAAAIQPSPLVDTEGSVPERGVQWVMIGEAGAKRHVFAQRLSKLLQVPHISMSTLLTQELSPRSALYQQIAKALDEGKLVPEEIIFGLLSKRLEEGYSRGETGFILNGIPRTRIQAEILDQIVDIDSVVNFKCSKEKLVAKDLGIPRFTSSREYLRMPRSMSPTKLLSHEHSEYPHPGNSWKENVHHHAEEKKLLEDYYREQNKLINVEVAGAPGETWQGLLAALHLKHISSSQKLTA
ncbi:putative adenylate kinase 7, mitochondrial [Senna tora]|uniref:adenylate kinase n=1 Tax=Senna tora TaxID=362788 RepID=A0A834W0T2_9FABA|nr:putative adenylate kinase 7, mitochondrial [Senna tora]